MKYDKVLKREQVYENIFLELNKFTDIKSALIYVISKIQELSGCEAVGVRLKKNGEYPFYVYSGFSESFITKDNSVYEDNSNEIIQSNHSKKYLLESLCGKGIGWIMEAKPEIFTKEGSFWSNDITNVLYLTNAEDRKLNTVSICNKHGYKSIAFIPIKINNENIGTIQLNDKKIGKFNLKLVEFIEIITKNISSIILNNGDCLNETDNNELKKIIEQQSIALKRAEELQEIRSSFFANLSHELRTPINIMLSSLSLIDLYKNKGLLKCGSDNINKQLYMLNQNCYRMLKLVNNSLDVTKIDSEYLELQLTNCNIINLIEEIVLSTVGYADNKGLKLIFDTDIEEKIICCDTDKIERIILNLLSNAVKFTDCGGKILVNIFDKGDKLIISVKDTGIGIPKDKLELVFDKFKQVDSVGERSRKGSGLGLSLVKSLVKMHGGDIFAKSNYGSGSEFIIELPIRKLDTFQEMKCELNNINLQDTIIENMRVEFSDVYDNISL